MSSTSDAARPAPSPLPWLQRMTDHLQTHEPALWKWFAGSVVDEEHTRKVKLELLKATYRIDRDAEPELYAQIDDVLEKSGIAAAVTCYQAQTGSGLNATLAYLPGEAHIIFSGQVLELLSAEERLAMLGHELAHFALLEQDDHAYLVAGEALRALAHDSATAPSHSRSEQLFQLFTETFADLHALHITGDPLPVVSTLVKLNTGLTNVSAKNYLRQAEEIFAGGSTTSEQLTHPEPYLRARAVQLWAAQGADALPEIEQMIAGPLRLEELDLLGQQHVESLTRRLITAYLQLPALRTDTLLAHARAFHDDFAITDDAPEDTTLADDLRTDDDRLRDYWCYVLLDFVATDRELEDLPASAAVVLADRLGLGERFGELLRDELEVSQRRFRKLESSAEKVIEKAEQG